MEKLETYGKKPLWLKVYKKLFLKDKKGFITLSFKKDKKLTRWL